VRGIGEERRGESEQGEGKEGMAIDEVEGRKARDN
jgi:hypothetical protein